ncbi:MAG: hypothetical protein ACD_79C00118G0001 [uncultured bacterium]|nr:MAG: hypothetical protein ACD_79C00118G0001 [uncultured bacterium]
MKVKSEIVSSTKINLFNQKNINITTQRTRPKSTIRRYLIPNTCRLFIGENKINNIYNELKNDLLLDDSKKAVPNAVGVLFRVFLETSVDHFADKKDISLLYLGGNSMKLKDKITKVASFMESNGIATKKQLKNMRSVANHKSSILAIESFHMYVHSYKHQPASNDLKTKWDNLEEFFIILWNSLKSKK